MARKALVEKSKKLSFNKAYMLQKCGRPKRFTEDSASAELL